MGICGVTDNSNMKARETVGRRAAVGKHELTLSDMSPSAVDCNPHGRLARRKSNG